MRGSGRCVATVAVLACVASGCASAQDIASAPGADNGERTGKGQRSGGPDKSGQRGDEKSNDKRPRKRRRNKNLEVDLRNVVGKVRRFSSPSTNIGCDLTAKGVRCDIEKRRYRPPRKPRSCNLDYGNAFTVGAGEPEFACVGDTVLGARRTLGYGTATRVGDYGCQSRRDGVRCYNLRTGRGFLVSRALYEFY